MNTIRLYCSNIAKITGYNNFQTKREHFINFWMNKNYLHYIETKNYFDNERLKAKQNKIIKKKLEEELQQKNIKIKLGKLSKKEIEKKIDNMKIDDNEKIKIKKEIKTINDIDENKPECKKEVNELLTDEKILKKAKLKKKNIKISKNVKELNKNKKELFNKIDKMNLKNNEKKIIKNSIESISNKKYGTKRESTIVEKLKNDYDINIIIDKTKKSQYLTKINNYQFIIVGELDGIYNNMVVEIKNRSNRLFKRIYNYEKVQLYMYMFLTGLKRCMLIENYRNDLNILYLNYNEDFMNELLNKIVIFLNFYIKFKDNIELQRIVLLGNDKDFKKIYLK